VLHPIEDKVRTTVAAYVEKHAPSAFWVAYSGGLDSTVLLHIISQQRQAFPDIALKAVHVHHGLQALADDWVEHCRQQAEKYRIPLVVKYVDAHAPRGESSEAVARDKRYDSIGEEIAVGDFLLLAQHQDDQAETFLLQLMRGAGPKGLAGMALCDPWQHGFKVRPLLTQSRQALEQYAQQNELQWIEDPSNQLLDFDRNFIRHKLMPVFMANWPAAGHMISRSAGLCAETEELTDELARRDLENVRSTDASLDIERLKTLPSVRRRNLIRYWVKGLGLPVPGYQVLTQLENTLIPAKDDAQPRVHWANVVARRYRNDLHVMLIEPKTPVIDLEWDLQYAIPLPGLGALSAIQGRGRGLSINRLRGRTLRVRFRQGGEKLRPIGDTCTRPLQKLLQRSAIPPWLREQIPLVFADQELVAVVGYWYANDYAASEGEESVDIKLISNCDSKKLSIV
jgi:tRNA(Ile)-lysidine synthase